MPASILKNKVTYRQFIHSVAFVNQKCCTCLRPSYLYFPDTPRTCKAAAAAAAAAAVATTATTTTTSISSSSSSSSSSYYYYYYYYL